MTFLFRSLSGGLHAMKSGNPVYNEFMGITDHDEIYDYHNSLEGYKRAYLASAWAMTCIRIRAQTVEGIPRLIKRKDGESLPENHPAVRFFNRRTSRLFYRTESHLMIWGAAYWRPYLHKGKLKINCLNPASVEVIKDEYGIKKFIQRVNGSAWTFKPEELVHFTLFDPDDDLGGLPPTAWILQTISVDAQMDRFSKSYFENDATPAGYFFNPSAVSDNDAERQVAWWRRFFQGVRNKGKMGYLDRGTEYRTVTPVMADLAMAELDEKTKRRIAGAYGVPTTISLMDDAANYSTSKEQHVSFYTTTILPQYDLLSGVIDEQFMPIWGFEYFGEKGLYLEPDTNSIEVLQEDRAEVTQRAQTGFTSGFTSFNGARKLNGEEEIKGGDFFVVPGVGIITQKEIEAGKLPLASQKPPDNPLGGMFGGLLPPPPKPDGGGSGGNPPPVVPPQPQDNAQPEQPKLETPQVPKLPTEQKPDDLQAQNKKALLLPETDGSFTSCAILLNLANQPDLVREALALKQVWDVPGWVWEPTNDYHVTLVYVTSITPENLEALRQEFSTFVVPNVLLHIGRTGFFNHAGEAGKNSFHFAVDPDPQLLNFQAALVDVCKRYGTVSPYSVPDAYKPHVTLAYSQAGILASPPLREAFSVPSYGAYLSAGGETEGAWTVLAAIKRLEPPAGMVIDGDWAARAKREAMLKDLDRWETKTARKGVSVTFKPDVLPAAHAAFIRMDLARGVPASKVFADARENVKAYDPNTPDEFEAYWNGIADLYDGLNSGVATHLQEYTPVLVDVLKNGSLVGFESLLVPVEAALTAFLAEQLKKVFLAGAARGNDLLTGIRGNANPVKAESGISVAWDIMDKQAADWAQQFAAEQVTRIGDTTRQHIRDVTSEWVASGGSLDQLADAIQGKLTLSDMALPSAPSLQKLAWLVSPERASLIAQTESTEVFHRGVQERWAQGGVQQMRSRNQNDGLVCPVCQRMNGVVGSIDGGFIDPETGETRTIPYHPGCRDFASPVL